MVKPAIIDERQGRLDERGRKRENRTETCKSVIWLGESEGAEPMVAEPKDT